MSQLDSLSDSAKNDLRRLIREGVLAALEQDRINQQKTALDVEISTAEATVRGIAMNTAKEKTLPNTK